MRKLAPVPVLKAMSIACLAMLLGGVSPAAAQLDQDPDALLDSAEKAMQESGDSLRQKESGKSLNNQSDAIQKLEEYKRATERSQSSNRDRSVITQRDLDDLLRQIEKAAREGNKEAAQRMLEQLAQIMENLQMAQPGQSGESDMEQALNELSDMIRKQQAIARQDFQAGPGFPA
ncbi:molecular chaperone GrpE (heat shock protein) [Bradyrhizobium ottawaense]